MIDIAVQPCCLIVEDEVLIGLALEADLEGVGIAVAGPYPSCAEGLCWIDTQTPALAILDFKLRDGPCTELAKTLLCRGVPVIVCSGLPRGAETPKELQGVTWLEKPVDRADLIEAAVRLAPLLKSPRCASAV